MSTWGYQKRLVHPMARWPISDDAAREMYAGGRGNETARWYARLWTRAFGLGLLPRRWVILEVPGRKTGRISSFPLGMADVDGRWYLVSMLGECNWVANVRAADGNVVLKRCHRQPVQLNEIAVERRAAVLRRYVQKVPGARPHVPLSEDASLADFASIAPRYPVFEVHEVGGAPAASPLGLTRFVLRRRWSEKGDI